MFEERRQMITIVSDHTKKGAQFGYIGRSSEILDRLDTTRQWMNCTVLDEVTKELGLMITELRFRRLQVDAARSQPIKDELKDGEVFIPSCSESEDIIEVGEDALEVIECVTRETSTNTP